ncbi:hypothetical protein ACHWQZ_G001421 [Mnemiopsis leidyi]
MLPLLLLSLVALSNCYEVSVDHFQQWAFDHGKTYENESVRAIRTLVWLDNAQFVKDKNAENNGATFKLNQYADLTHEEYKALLSPISDDAITRAPEDMIAMALPPWVNIPDSKDWREENAVTPVKNQGACGSCYSFSTTGALEGACAIKTGKLQSFSEQQIMDCSWQYGNNGCNGGMFDRAFYYIQQQGGIDSEAAYAYTAKESHTCKYDPKSKAGQVTGFYYVKQEDENALQAVLALKGPVAIAINAGLRSFQFYSSGVYDDPTCDATLNHGVLAVGYGTDKDSGKDYFLVKNSWGPDWGLGGYIKMRRNSNNQCGIATYPSIPDC